MSPGPATLSPTTSSWSVPRPLRPEPVPSTRSSSTDPNHLRWKHGSKCGLRHREAICQSSCASPIAATTGRRTCWKAQMKADSSGRCAHLAIAALLLLLAASARAQAPTCPKPGEWPMKLRLEYAVTASRGPFSINGESILAFERNGRSYSVTVDTDSTVIYHARQTSRGTIEASGLRPLEFTEVRGSKAPQTATFDWDAKLVHFSAAADSPTPTEAG